MTDHAQWMSPAPLWSDSVAVSEGGVGGAMRRPAILRFATDTFMDDYQRVLDTDPSNLSSLRATPETWRGPLPVIEAPAPPPSFLREAERRRRLRGRVNGTTPAIAQTTPLKLYAPAHQRFYLVSACLVCRIAGLPDRVIDPGMHERATFVVRRLGDPGSGEEYAFVIHGATNGWRKVTNSQALEENEEQLPLSGVNFQDDTGRRRRLLTGLIPVGKRETYLGAQRLPGVSDPPPDAPDPRILQLQTQVTGPWVNLLERATIVHRQIIPGPNPDPGVQTPTEPQVTRRRREVREQLQTGSWYVLLDFSHYLRSQLPRVWAALGGNPPADINTNEQNLVNRLRSAVLGNALKIDLILPEAGQSRSTYNASDIFDSLADALTGIGQFEHDLEAVTVPYDRTVRGNGWPTRLFPLADPKDIDSVPTPPAQGLQDPIDAATQGVHDLEDLIGKALPRDVAGQTPNVPLAVQPVMDPRGATEFVIRCVFERPDCGPLVQPVVSEPSTEFQLAGFFDPDAPARPIRIALPGDITPAGLRKFDKNTAFMISDALCGQLTRIRNHITLGDLVLSVLPWPFHKDLPSEASGAGAPCTPPGGGDSIGMICTLSLPIITICALIVLFVFVILFDIVFRWLPYFFICFPLPRFKAKPS